MLFWGGLYLTYLLVFENEKVLLYKKIPVLNAKTKNGWWVVQG